MVKVRGRNSNGKTVKQTVKNGRKISGDDAARPAWVMVPGVSSSRLRTDSDQSRIWCRARPWLVCDSLNELTWVSFVVHWHLTLWQSFFFFFLSCRECCLTRQWQSIECDKRYMVQRRKEFDVILRFLVDRYRRTKPPKPDASQVVVPARLPKPVIGSGGLSSTRFDDDVPEVNYTWTACRRSRGESRKQRFDSNRMAPKSWQEGQHDLHSPPQPIDQWREHTIGAVHDRNLPTRSLQVPVQVPESYENFLWHRVKVRSIVTGLRRDDERDDDHSHRRVSIMSSLDAGWFRLITNILIQSRDLASEVAPVWHHDVTNARTCQFFAVCLTFFPFEFRPRTFTIGFYGKNSIISELMILECSFPF